MQHFNDVNNIIMAMIFIFAVGVVALILAAIAAVYALINLITSIL